MKSDKLDIKFENIKNLNGEGFLWRYMDFHKFLSFILRKELFLTRNTLFEDRTESSQPFQHIVNILKNRLDKDPLFDKFDGFIKTDNLAETKGQLEKELTNSQRSNFSNCWFYTKSEYESIAMWNLYSKPNGVAVKVNLKDFLKIFKEEKFQFDRPVKSLTLGLVKYINYQNFVELIDISQNINLFPFFKDISYSHEVEFRVNARIELTELDEIRFNKSTTDEQKKRISKKVNNYPGIRLELFDFNEIPFQIKFHPKSDEWAKKDIQDLLKKYQVSFGVEDSSLKLN